MPERTFGRNQVFLLPPAFDDWVGDDHPVRFVEAFMALVSPATRAALGMSDAPEAVGAPRYAPAMLARVWVYGFLTGEISTRDLEAACRDRVSYRWLTGDQTPDHSTLSRWYKEHRDGVAALLHESVVVAALMGVLSFRLLAVDGTKLQANAAADQMLTDEALDKLTEHVNAAIAAMEAQNVGSDEPTPPGLPRELHRAEALLERIARAKAAVAERAAARGKAKSVNAPRANVTDPEARWVKVGAKTVPGYNAQVAVLETNERAQSLLGPRAPAGRIVVAATVTTQPNDSAQLATMVAAARANLGVTPVVTVADAGYFTGAELEQAAALGTMAVVSESDPRAPNAPYHRVHFDHRPVHDTLTCPEGQTLRRLNPDAPPEQARRYGGIAATCRSCPAFTTCTSNAKAGRTVSISAHDAAIQAHRQLRRWAPHRIIRARRKGLIEGVIGTLKTVLGDRQVRYRGRANVEAEWQGRAVGYNLRTLIRIWQATPADQRWQLLPTAA